MPRLQVHSESPGSLDRHTESQAIPHNTSVSKETISTMTFCGLHLVATLVNITCCVVVHTKHRNQPIGSAICLKT